MKKPEKKEMQEVLEKRSFGAKCYNCACDDWEKYHNQEINKLEMGYEECKRQRKILEDKEDKFWKWLPSEFQDVDKAIEWLKKNTKGGINEC